MKITAKDNISLLNLILFAFPEISISKAKKMIMYGFISYKGAIIKSPELIIRKGEIIEYRKYRGGKRIAREKTDIPILYEDQDIIAVIKPFGVWVDAKPNEKIKSLYSLTKNYVRRKWGQKQNVFIVHELRVDEAGVCLFAKTKKVQEILKKNFPNFKREYNALICGTPKHKNDKLNLWLRKEERGKLFLEAPNSEGAELCVIQYKTIESFENYSHILIIPQTNSNNIRFGFYSIGNSIIGDTLFDKRQRNNNFLKLYLTSIELQQPITGKKLKIETSLPQTFIKVNLPIFIDIAEKEK